MADKITDLHRRHEHERHQMTAAHAGAHGQFRAKAEAAGESTHSYAEEHKGDSGKTGAQARLALTLMGMHGHRAAKRYAGPKKG